MISAIDRFSMPLADYFCHTCQQNVSRRDGDLICDQCRGEFIEELPQRRRLPMYPFGRRLVNTMISDAVGSQQSNEIPETSPTHPRIVFTANRTASNEDNIISMFLNQLLSNLSAQGAQIQFQVGLDSNLHTTVLHGTPGDYAWGDIGLDQIVTQLLNQFESGATPIDESLLANIPITSVKQKDVESASQCTTCMEIFKLDEEVAILNCQHIFHRECILPWLKRHNTCPICRQAVDATKWSYTNPLDELD